MMHKFAHYPGYVRIVLFLLLLVLAWLPTAVPLYLWLGTTGPYSVAYLIALYITFIGWLRMWGRKVHGQALPLQSHGLVLSTQNMRELITGMWVGLVSLGLLFVIESWMGWLTWMALPASFLRILGEGLLVGLGVAWAEELLFRGWLLNELRYGWRFSSALWASSFFYATLHFIKPLQAILSSLPSFPGLLLLGLTLGWARQRNQGRLGLAIGLHGGLVWGYYLIDVGDLASYTRTVPEWVTGISQNPLAGAMGVIFLSLIAAGIRYLPRHPTQQDAD
jgi:uncharacterized protein